MIRPLTTADIPGAMRLKEAANWNQTAEDWELVLRLAPRGCFGLEYEGTLAATTTAVCYGRELAWIGMVLTDPALRGRGFARRLMEHAIDYLERNDVEWIKLDATDMGYPLYRKLGFEDECVVERWLRPAGAVPGTPADGAFSLKEWLVADRQAFGADREQLLAALSRGEAVSLPGGGYAMGRPGAKAAYFGPCVARTSGAARALLEWFLIRHAGEPVFWDILPQNSAALELAREFGFERRRELVRMVRRGAPPARDLQHNDSDIFALAGFEYG